MWHEGRLLTYALALVGDPDRPSQNACGSSEVAGAGINNTIIPTQVLLRRGSLRTHAVAGDAVGVVDLVHHARGGAGTVDVLTRFCKRDV